MKNTMILIFAVTLVLLFDQTASACVCAPPPTDTEVQLRAAVTSTFKRSDAIFSGEAVASGENGVEFKIDRVWKGTFKDKTALVPEHGTCDYHFKAGLKYLVFARPVMDGLRVPLCSLTSVLSEAERLINELERLSLVGIDMPFGVFQNQSRSGVEGTMWRLECKSNCPASESPLSSPRVIQFLPKGTVRVAIEQNSPKYREQPCYSEYVSMTALSSWAQTGNTFEVQIFDGAARISGQVTDKRMSAVIIENSQEPQAWEGMELFAGRKYPSCVWAK
jgi:hypothetical protein